jgi:hypothetical protein
MPVILLLILSRLAHAANLKKEISGLLEQWLQENTAANLARWLIEQRQRAVSAADETPAPEAASSGNGNSASDIFWRSTSLRLRIPATVAESTATPGSVLRSARDGLAATLSAASVRGGLS